MRFYFLTGYLFIVSICFLAQDTCAQGVQLTLGPDEIGENQNWTITLTINNDQLKSYDNFPDIEGFRKNGTSTQSSTNIINGHISSSQSVMMNYAPTKRGTFILKPFTMKVNEKKIGSPGKKIKVGAPIQQQRDPFSSFFDRSPSDDFFGRRETEFLDVKDDAFLAITTSKNEVYVGEAFNATLSLFVAENNKAPLQFHELDKQIPDILKKMKPATCWEENFKIETIEATPVTIQGKNYNQYKIYQAAYYPLNNATVRIPSVGLEMIKYKVAKNPSFFGQNRKEDYKTFYSKPTVVKVKDLPPHPLKDAVAVGDYRLDERMLSTNLKTGQSAGYEFNVYGEGNISSIEKPSIINNGNFEFYEPNVRENINHESNRVTGTKSFSYFMIPKEPGTYKLGDYVNWIFFNLKTKKYDTLKSKLTVTVSGESKKNEDIQSNDLGSFYDKIRTVDNELKIVEDTRWQKWGFNIFILLMLIASAYLVIKK